MITNRRRRRLNWVAVIPVGSYFLLAFAPCEFGQNVDSSQVFEVASLKLNASGELRSTRHIAHGELTMRNAPLRECIEVAYGITGTNGYQLSGPSWINSTRYDILAKAAADVSPDTVRTMLRNLLADRFKLQVHYGPKTISAYALVVAKGGSKIRPVDPTSCDQCTGGVRASTKDQTAPSANGGDHKQGMAIDAQGVTMQQFATSLARHLNQPVTDRTGLDGIYTFRLKYATEGDSPGTTSAEPNPDRAPQLSIFSALPSQLGLKLESQKLQVSTVVIDHIDRVAGDN